MCMGFWARILAMRSCFDRARGRLWTEGSRQRRRREQRIGIKDVKSRIVKGKAIGDLTS